MEQIEFNMKKQELPFKVLGFVDSNKQDFNNKKLEEEHDYYMVIEQNEEFGLIVCWNKEDGFDPSENYVYRVKFK